MFIPQNLIFEEFNGAKMSKSALYTNIIKQFKILAILYLSNYQNISHRLFHYSRAIALSLVVPGGLLGPDASRLFLSPVCCTVIVCRKSVKFKLIINCTF